MCVCWAKPHAQLRPRTRAPSYVVRAHIEPAVDRCDVAEGGREPTAIMRVETMAHARDIRRIRDQVTNYLSALFPAGHLAEAVGGPGASLRAEFVWALVFERELGDAVNSK